MANIGGELNKKSTKKVSTSVAGTFAQTALDDLKGEVSNVKNIMYVVIFVLLLGFMGAIYSYFEMTRNSFNDYKNTLDQINKQLNNERYNNLENRIKDLENTLHATPSAR